MQVRCNGYVQLVQLAPVTGHYLRNDYELTGTYDGAFTQDFNTDCPNKIWAGDVTHYLFKGKDYYICVILDLFARKVVAYKIGFRDNTHLTKATLLLAIRNRQPTSGLVFHSDQGASYRSYTYRRCLLAHGITQSFSRPRTPQDNAPMESFFSSLKSEELHRVRYRSVREFYASVKKYIEWYNSSRPHQNLRYSTPDAYESRYNMTNQSESTPEN